MKAIEEIELSYGASLPAVELTQLVNVLIDNYQIKDIIMKSISDGSAKEDIKLAKEDTNLPYYNGNRG